MSWTLKEWIVSGSLRDVLYLDPLKNVGHLRNVGS